MTSDPQTDDPEREGEAPATEELEEPSTEKEPGDEPKAGDTSDAEPSHEAVGIGVISSGEPDDAPDADADGDADPNDEAAAGDGAEGDREGARSADVDGGPSEATDPPSPAMTDEVRRAAAEHQ